MADTKKIVNIDERTWSYNDIQYWVNPADKTANAMINFDDKLARLRAGIIILKNDTILFNVIKSRSLLNNKRYSGFSFVIWYVSAPQSTWITPITI